MKNLLLLIALLAIEAHAQRYTRFNPVTDSTIRANGISELRISETHISKKGKISTYKRIFHYDNNGIATFYGLIEDTLKYKRLVISEMMSQPGEKNYGMGKASAESEGRDNWFYFYEYNGNNMVKAFHSFNDRGRNMTNMFYTYDDSNKITRLEYYNRRHQLIKYYQYVYASNSKLQHTALYKGNGKLKRYWDYNCDDEGSMSKKIKDTIKICTSKTYLADGTVVTTTNSFDYRGNPVKYVEYRNSNDKVVKSLRYEGKNEVLTYRNTIEYENNREVKKYTYYASDKGKPFFSTALLYDANGQVTAQADTNFSKKKNDIRNYTFKYGSNGLLISKQGFHNRRLSTVYSFSYLYYRKEK